MTNNPAQDSL